VAILINLQAGKAPVKVAHPIQKQIRHIQLARKFLAAVWGSIIMAISACLVKRVIIAKIMEFILVNQEATLAVPGGAVAKNVKITMQLLGENLIFASPAAVIILTIVLEHDA